MSSEEIIPPEMPPAAGSVADLEGRLTAAEAKRDEALRSLAEFENIRKRQQRDWEAEKKFAPQKLLIDLLPAIDNLDRAVAAARAAGEQGSLVMGVVATQMQLLDALKRHGVARIEALGKPFDPHTQEAIASEAGDAEPDTVVRVEQAGYMLHERVLRPAAVVVSKRE